MNRIEPQEVVQSFKETRLAPTQMFMYTEGCACGLGVILYKKFNGKMPKDDWTAAFNIFGTSYSWSFVMGFDGISEESAKKDRLYPYNEIGYADGRDSWIACQDAGLV